MKQNNVLFPEIVFYFFEGVTLLPVELYGIAVGGGFGFLKAAYLLLFDYKNSLFFEGFQPGQTFGEPFEQFGPGYRAQVSGEALRKVYVFDEQFQLLFGAFLQLIVSFLKTLFMGVIIAEPYKIFNPGFIAVVQSFFGDDQPFFDHGVDKRDDPYLADGARCFVQRHGTGFLQSGDEHVFFLAKRIGVDHRTAVEHNLRFAGQLERRRQRRIHHLAGGTAVIGGHPFPEPELHFVDHRLHIQHRKNIFGLDAWRRFRDFTDERRVNFFWPELHNHPFPHDDRFVQFKRNAVGKISGYRQRQ